MAAKKHDAGDTKKRKRPNTETHEDPKASNLIASKKHKLDSVAKDNKNKKTPAENVVFIPRFLSLIIRISTISLWIVPGFLQFLFLFYAN